MADLCVGRGVDIGNAINGHWLVRGSISGLGDKIFGYNYKREIAMV